MPGPIRTPTSHGSTSRTRTCRRVPCPLAGVLGACAADKRCKLRASKSLVTVNGDFFYTDPSRTCYTLGPIVDRRQLSSTRPPRRRSCLPSAETAAPGWGRPRELRFGLQSADGNVLGTPGRQPYSTARTRRASSTAIGGLSSRSRCRGLLRRHLPLPIRTYASARRVRLRTDDRHSAAGGHLRRSSASGAAAEWMQWQSAKPAGRRAFVPVARPGLHGRGFAHPRYRRVTAGDHAGQASIRARRSASTRPASSLSSGDRRPQPRSRWG